MATLAEKIELETGRKLPTNEQVSRWDAQAGLGPWKGTWQSGTQYKAGDGVSNGGNTYRRKADGTSGASFDATQWDIVAQGGGATVLPGSVTGDGLEATLKEKLGSLYIDTKGSLSFTDENGNIGAKLATNGDFLVNKLITQALQIAGGLTARTLNNIEIIDNRNYALLLTDENGWIGYAVNNDGTRLEATVPNVNFQSVSVADNINAKSINNMTLIDSKGYSLVLTDENGWIGYAIDLNGQAVSNTKKRVFGLLADINHYHAFGQSLSLGVNGGPVVTTAQESHVITFTKGPIMSLYDNDATRYNGLVNEVETTQESPCGAMGRVIKQALASSNIALDTYLYDILVSAPGTGATAISGFQKGTAPYARFMEGINAALALATAGGKSYNVPSVFWLQGEADIQSATSLLTYKNSLVALYGSLNADVKAATGQDNELVWLTYQVASHNPHNRYPDIALAQLQLALTTPNFYMGPAMYAYAYSDQIHLANGTEYAKVGALAGYIQKRIVVDGIEWKPIYLKSWKLAATRLDLTFTVPVLPLVIDPAAVVDPGAFGFRLFDRSGVEQTIISVAVIRPDTVRIVASGPIQKGFKLTYAINGTAGKSGKTEGSRGCLRDSQGITIKYTGSGLVDHPLHNWCPIFEQNL